jgi:hypothetical protein
MIAWIWSAWSSRSIWIHLCGDGDYSHMPKSRWRQKYEAKMKSKVEQPDEDAEGEVTVTG